MYQHPAALEQWIITHSFTLGVQPQVVAGPAFAIIRLTDPRPHHQGAVTLYHFTALRTGFTKCRARCSVSHLVDSLYPLGGVVRLPVPAPGPKWEGKKSEGGVNVFQCPALTLLKTGAMDWRWRGAQHAQWGDSSEEGANWALTHR